MPALRLGDRRLVQQAAPGGERKGDEYIPRNPMRADQEPGAFFINIKKKCWNDFADGSSGDLITLIAGIHGIKRNEAANYLIEELNPDHDEKEVANMSTVPLSNQDKRQDDVEVISLPKYPEDLPLVEGESYRALEKRKAAPVLVVEGDKAALAAHKKAEWQDYAPVASAGGVNAATSTDWTAFIIGS